MSLYQASFRLRHECPYRELSAEFPDIVIREWYLSDCQVLEITSQTAPTGELVEAVERLGTVLHRTVDDAGLHLVTQSCLCSLEESIIGRFETHNCLYQPPTVHRQGWEHYTVIGFTEADLRALHDDLDGDRDIEVLSKTELTDAQIPHHMLAPVDELFADLTSRQLAALQLALDRGYYEQPRRCSMRDLAEDTTVARATFEEHLRKAEDKLMRNAGQFVRLLSKSRAAEDLLVPADQPLARSD